MLSKSQARLFFVSGTALFSLLFLFLTVDTVRQVPAQTKGRNITPAVERGKKLWDENNCMGCHTLLGEGAYYAPELTKVYPRRGAVWIDIFLKDPQAMFPGERKMVQYNFTARQRQDLIAFFKWISEMDLNGFPPKPNLAKGSSDKPAPSGQPQTGVARRAPAPPLTRKQPQPSRRATSPSSRSATRQLANAPNQAKNKAPAKPPTIFRQLCIACHSLHGQGGKVGPALDHVGRKYTPVYLQKWLTDPQAVKPGTQMPKLPLSKDNLTKLVEYLSQLK